MARRRAVSKPPSSKATDAQTAQRRPPPASVPWRDAAAVAIAMLVIYAVTAPRTVTLEDSGIFIMSSDAAGISHPPGYPLHSLLGKLFSLLPLGSVAFRIHLLSATFGALTCAVLFCIGHALVSSRTAAYAMALPYGISREFWAQSIIAEVYSLNTFVFFLLVLLAIRSGKDPTPPTLRWTAILVGLGLSHHWPLFLLALPGVGVILWPRRREIVPHLLRAAPFLALGLTPFLYMVARSNMNPPISFYGPIDSLDRFLFTVLRSGYADMDASATAGWADRFGFAGFLFREMVAQFTPLGALFAAVGAALSWRRWPKNIAAGLVVTFAGGTLGLLLLLDRDFGYLERAVFKVYPLIPYGIMAVWLGAGIKEIASWVSLRWGAAAGRPAGAVFCGTVLAACWLGNAKVNSRSGYTWARDYGQIVLDSVDPNAIVITTADADTGPLGYLNRVERVRPDVELYNDKGLVFSNRLFRPPQSDRARLQAFRRLIESTERPAYVVGELSLGYPTEDFGLFKKVLRSGERGEKSVTISPRILEHCRAVAAQTDHTDMWTVEHRNVLLVDCGRLLGPVVHFSNAPGRSPEYGEVLATVTRHAHGKIGLLEGLAERGDPDQLMRWVEDAEKMLDPTHSKQATSRLLFIRGFVQHRKGLAADAIRSFQLSVEVFPDRRNGAVLGLLSLYAAQRKRNDYLHLRDTIYAGHSVPSSVEELDRSLAK